MIEEDKTSVSDQSSIFLSTLPLHFGREQSRGLDCAWVVVDVVHFCY